MCATSWSDFDLMFDLSVVTLIYKFLFGLYLGNSKVCSPSIFEISFSYDKDIWVIAATDYYMHFYIIDLFPLTAILKLINFTAS